MIGVNFIIIDEVSMVGCTMLNMIHKRLQEVKGSSKLFGGIQPIFVGDMFQLRPVKDSGWIFETEKSNYGPLAINLWVNNIRMFELTEIMRQGDDKQFAELLNRVREGNQTIDDETIFESRFIKPNEDIDPYLPHLFTVNKSVAKHNKVCYDKMNTEKRKIVAFDDIKGGDMNDELREKLLSKISPDPRNTSRMIKELELAIDLSYKIVLNLNVQDGLTNGALCTLQKFQLEDPSKPKGILWVKFSDEEIGQNLRKKYDKKHSKTHEISCGWTPIYPETREFSHNKGNKKIIMVSRTQFPLEPATASTVHKSQGLTLKSDIVVDFSFWTQAHMLYVALSRVDKLSKLHIKKFDLKRIRVDDRVKLEMKRLRELGYPFCLKFLHNTPGILKISFINTQSMNRHLEDVRHDKTLLSSDVIVCLETWWIETDPIETTFIKGYKTHRFDSLLSIRKQGLAVFIRENIDINDNNFQIFRNWY